MFILEDDFYHYDNGSITRIAVSRILQGAGHPLSSTALSRKKLPTTAPSAAVGTKASPTSVFSYCDFVHFILANEDKTSASSIEYWFRVLDTDSDGVLSMYELQPFWAEQNARMVQWRIGDPWSYRDFICVVYVAFKPTLLLTPVYIALI